MSYDATAIVMLLVVPSEVDTMDDSMVDFQFFLPSHLPADLYNVFIFYKPLCLQIALAINYWFTTIVTI